MRTTKTGKTFDCIEFKRQSQARLMAEYEARKQEFASFRAFVDAKAEEDPWASRLWQTLIST